MCVKSEYINTISQGYLRNEQCPNEIFCYKKIPSLSYMKLEICV